MARHKFATIRYQTLDRCFRNPGRKYFLEDLLYACNEALYAHNGSGAAIKERQLFEDIAFMESEAGWSIPLNRVREGRRVYYRYVDMRFSINNQPLNTQEMMQLQLGIDLLSRIKGLPELADLRSVLSRLRTAVGANLTPAIGFDHNPRLSGIEHLGPLFSAILDKQPLRIEYQSFVSEAPQSVLFHPYFLKQYNKRWFLFGVHAETQTPNWVLALDRIKSLDAVSIPFVAASGIDLETYFDDIIGVTKPSEVLPEEIDIWFAPAAAPYVLTKPLHRSQVAIHQTEGGAIIRLHVIPNVEFFQAVLAFGQHARVLRPASMVEQVRQILEDAYKGYTAALPTDYPL